jgi:hypothetical protein
VLGLVPMTCLRALEVRESKNSCKTRWRPWSCAAVSSSLACSSMAASTHNGDDGGGVRGVLVWSGAIKPGRDVMLLELRKKRDNGAAHCVGFVSKTNANESGSYLPSSEASKAVSESRDLPMFSNSVSISSFVPESFAWAYRATMPSKSTHGQTAKQHQPREVPAWSTPGQRFV